MGKIEKRSKIKAVKEEKKKKSSRSKNTKIVQKSTFDMMHIPDRKKLKTHDVPVKKNGAMICDKLLPTCNFFKRIVKGQEICKKDKPMVIKKRVELGKGVNISSTSNSHPEISENRPKILSKVLENPLHKEADNENKKRGRDIFEFVGNDPNESSIHDEIDSISRLTSALFSIPKDSKTLSPVKSVKSAKVKRQITSKEIDMYQSFCMQMAIQKFKDLKINGKDDDHLKESITFLQNLAAEKKKDELRILEMSQSQASCTSETQTTQIFEALFPEVQTKSSHTMIFPQSSYETQPEWPKFELPTLLFKDKNSNSKTVAKNKNHEEYKEANERVSSERLDRISEFLQDCRLMQKHTNSGNEVNYLRSEKICEDVGKNGDERQDGLVLEASEKNSGLNFHELSYYRHKKDFGKNLDTHREKMEHSSEEQPYMYLQIPSTDIFNRNNSDNREYTQPSKYATVEDYRGIFRQPIYKNTKKDQLRRKN